MIGAFDHTIGVVANGVDRDRGAIVVAFALESASNPTVAGLRRNSVRSELVRNESFEYGADA
jgi:hypothetical protein